MPSSDHTIDLAVAALLDAHPITTDAELVALAAELGRVRDWVVIYFERDGHEGQCTVVTEYRGLLTGKRVVRGREDEVEALEGLKDS